MSSLPPIPPKGHKSTRQEDLNNIAEALSYYDRPDVKEMVRSQAKQVAAWLIDNRGSTDKRGDIKTGEPWLPINNLDRTDDADRLDLRVAAVRKRLFGQGLRRFLNLLADKGILSGAALDRICEVTGFTYMALLEELMGYALSPGGKKTIGLEDLKSRFELSDRGNANVLRPRVVMPLALFGLIRAKIDDESRYTIRIGLVGHVFFTDVFAPVRAHFADKLAHGGKE